MRKLLKYQPFDRATAVQALCDLIPEPLSSGDLFTELDHSVQRIPMPVLVLCLCGEARAHTWFHDAAPFLRHAVPVQPNVVPARTIGELVRSVISGSCCWLIVWDDLPMPDHLKVMK